MGGSLDKAATPNLAGDDPFSVRAHTMQLGPTLLMVVARPVHLQSGVGPLCVP